MDFFTGIPEPAWAYRFDRCMISINRLNRRKSDFQVNNWLMDGAGFNEILRFKDYRLSTYDYSCIAKRWSRLGNCQAVVTQDYMCEQFILDICERTVEKHQELTVQRYDEILGYGVGTYLMPVLQGYKPFEYVDCIRLYGTRLKKDSWVGVGSICKRNSNVDSVLEVLTAIKRERPDLKLHGFGLKKTALQSYKVRSLLHSSDSMAWSLAARNEGRDCNHWIEAINYTNEINHLLSLS